MSYDNLSQPYIDNEEEFTENPATVEQTAQAAPALGFIRPMSTQDRESVNTVIRLSESITRSMLTDWEARNKLRKAIAEMTCPWSRGQIIQIGSGQGPMDRRVIVGVLPGRTEIGEYYKVRTRVLAKGAKPGKREVGLGLKEDLEITVMGMFDGVLPEMEEAVSDESKLI
jgi:hypothetical protein